MALTTPITRTAVVSAAQAGQNGTVAVQLAVQPTTSAPGANAQLVLSATEWNEIAAQASATGGPNGIGVSVSITIQ